VSVAAVRPNLSAYCKRDDSSRRLYALELDYVWTLLQESSRLVPAILNGSTPTLRRTSALVKGRPGPPFNG